MSRVLAGDIGGTHLRAALVDEDGTIAVRRQAPTPAKATSEEIIAAVTALFREVREASEHTPVALCVAMAGLVDATGGRIISSPNVAGARNLALGPALQQAVGVGAFVENDASAAALGEYRFGAGRGVRNVLHITLGTGVGGGIVADGHLYRGEHGLAGEVGHMIIEPGGPRCNCGSHGCIEAVASGSAFGRRARAIVEAGTSARLREMTAGREATSEDLFEAAKAGDRVCEDAIRHGGRLLGLGLGGLVNALDPGRVTLSGGLLAMGEMLLGPMEEAVHSLSFGPATEAVFALSTLGDDAGLLGAAAVAFERAETGS